MPPNDQTDLNDSPLLSHRAPGILTSVGHDAPEYVAAIISWPDAEPLWPLLPAGAARLHFARFCLTSRRAPSTGPGIPDHLDTSGLAAGLCARSSSRVNLGPTARQNLLLHYRVDVAEAPPKLRVPLLMATSPEHVFNAIYLGGRTDSITSYLFVDVLEDELIVPLSEHWHRHVARAWVVLSDLVDCQPQGRLVTLYVQGFERGRSGRMTAVSRERASELHQRESFKRE